MKKKKKITPAGSRESLQNVNENKNNYRLLKHYLCELWQVGLGKNGIIKGLCAKLYILKKMRSFKNIFMLLNIITNFISNLEKEFRGGKLVSQMRKESKLKQE